MCCCQSAYQRIIKVQTKRINSYFFGNISTSMNGMKCWCVYNSTISSNVLLCCLLCVFPLFFSPIRFNRSSNAHSHGFAFGPSAGAQTWSSSSELLRKKEEAPHVRRGSHIGTLESVCITCPEWIAKRKRNCDTQHSR